MGVSTVILKIIIYLFLCFYTHNVYVAIYHIYISRRFEAVSVILKSVIPSGDNVFVNGEGGENGGLRNLCGVPGPTLSVFRLVRS